MADGQQVQADPLGSGQSQDRGEPVELAVPSRPGSAILEPVLPAAGNNQGVVGEALSLKSIAAELA